MSKIEKLTVASMVISVAVATALYGVWEDKVLLYGPLLVAVYAVLAVWAVGRLLWQKRSDVNDQRSEVRNQTSEAAREQKLQQNTVGLHCLPSALRSPISDHCSPTSDLRPLTSGSRIPLGGILLLLFFLYSAVMIPFSVLPYEAKISTLRFGCYLGAYWATAKILSRFFYRKTVWILVFTVLVLIALYSLVQHKVNPAMLFGVERYVDYGERLGGTYICPNHIAHLYQMWIPFCLVFLFIPQFGWFWRICFGYAIPLFLLLIYQTQSRASLLGTVAAVGTTVLFSILRKSRKAFWVALLVMPLLCAGAVGGLWAGSSMFRTRMQPVVKFFEHHMDEDRVSDEFKDFRPQTWLDTIDMIKARPVFGFGPGNYGLTYEDYHKRYKTVGRATLHAHNEYLELTAEYGLIGAMLVLCALVCVAVSLIRFICSSPPAHHALPAVALLGALAGTAVHGFFDFELRIFPNAMMLALLAGCAVAPQVRQRSDVKSQKSVRTYLISVLRSLISITLLFAAGWSVQVMSSAWIRAYGDRLLKKENYNSAERWFQTAHRIDPQNGPAQYGLGQVYFYHRYYELDPVRKQDWAQKEKTAYEAAYRLNPKKKEVVYGLARVELFLGNRDKGLDYLRQVAAYARFDDFYWRKLGIELRKAGLYDEALKTFEYALTLNRSNPTVKRNIQWLRVRLKGGNS